MQVRLRLPPSSCLLGCSPIVIRTKASHRFNQLPKKVPAVSETGRKCLSNGVFSDGDYGLVQIQEGLQLLGCQWLLQQRASGVGILAVVKRHVVDTLHVCL